MQSLALACTMDNALVYATHADWCGWYEYIEKKTCGRFLQLIVLCCALRHTYCIDELVRCDRYDSKNTRDERNWFLWVTSLTRTAQVPIHNLPTPICWKQNLKCDCSMCYELRTSATAFSLLFNFFATPNYFRNDFFGGAWMEKNCHAKQI